MNFSINMRDFLKIFLSYNQAVIMSIGLMHKVDPLAIQQHFFSNNSPYYLKVFGPQGKGLSFFAGGYTQRGSGLLGDLFRKFGIPLLKHATPHVLGGVSQLVRDVRKGKPAKKSARKTTLKTVESILKGKGKKRKRKRKPKKSPKKSKLSVRPQNERQRNEQKK
ncbi:MAG: hypothetical protein GY804_04315 [Alphaproteobacteria bacterium]|nr:hypothetical protein [Alphaproteobacteria bacterium]